MNADLDKVLETVAALLYRAGHEGTPEEEARTSAVLAARLISKHALVITRPAPEQAEEPAGRRRPRWWNEPAARSSAGWREAVETPPAPPRTRPPPTPTERAARTRSRAAEAQRTVRAYVAASPGDYVVITSEYKGSCIACSRRYRKGSRIAWKRGEGATHYGCRMFWDDPDGWDPEGSVDDPLG